MDPFFVGSKTINPISTLRILNFFKAQRLAESFITNVVIVQQQQQQRKADVLHFPISKQQKGLSLLPWV